MKIAEKDFDVLPVAGALHCNLKGCQKLAGVEAALAADSPG